MKALSNSMTEKGLRTADSGRSTEGMQARPSAEAAPSGCDEGSQCSADDEAAPSAVRRAPNADEVQHRCSNVDVCTREEIAGRLLHCLASEMVFRSISADEALNELQKGVLDESGPETAFAFGLALLRQRIDKVAKKKNFGTALALVFTKDQFDAKVEHKARKLEQSGAFASEVRDRLAATLIRHYDLARHHHCGFDLTQRTPEDVERHAATCRFRAMHCPNPGCGACLSALEMDAHDEACPFKLLPCPRGCGSQVARKAVAEHVDGACGRRPVCCPFQRIGCEVGCTQGELPRHMEEQVQQHLLLALGQLSSQQQQIDRFTAQVLDARNKVHAAEAEVAASKREMAALSKSFVALQKEHGALHKQLAAQDAHAKKADAEIAKLVSTHGAMGKELRASIDKLSGEHASTRRTVEAIRAPEKPK